MSSRIPWVAATLIIVVAAGLGAWMLSTPLTTTVGSRVEGWGGAVSTSAGWTPVQSTSGPLATGGVINGVGWAAIGGTDNVGIENIYILDVGGYAGTENDDNFQGGPAYLMGRITATLGSVNIPYENTFAIAVGIKAKAPDNMAYVRKENMQVDVRLVFPGVTVEENSGNDNSTGAYTGVEVLRYATGLGTTSGFIWVNAIWDNAGAGYILGAGNSLDIQRVTLWTWK